MTASSASCGHFFNKRWSVVARSVAVFGIFIRFQMSSSKRFSSRGPHSTTMGDCILREPEPLRTHPCLSIAFADAEVFEAMPEASYPLMHLRLLVTGKLERAFISKKVSNHRVESGPWSYPNSPSAIVRILNTVGNALFALLLVRL